MFGFPSEGKHSENRKKWTVASICRHALEVGLTTCRLNTLTV